HRAHHRRSTFGTIHDPEYAPIAQWGRLRLLGFIGGALVVPLLLVFRWGVLGPVSFLIPPLRRLVLQRASSLVINLRYRRPLPPRSRARGWILQEATTTAVCWIASAAALLGGIASWWVLQWYIVAAGIVLVNQLRTLAAHRYEQYDGRPLDTTAQLLDSMTLTGWPLTVLAAPLGLRYHALHHAYPTMPYHSLGALHRRLLAELPADAPYRHTLQAGIFSVVSRLWRRHHRPPTLPLLSEKRAAGGA
ncbi:MAG: fatty acid desaturase, partial [Candidatus Binatia bacterium]|nr:fatty acid desaturase [Candidatus Binatia bacterium]